MKAELLFVWALPAQASNAARGKIAFHAGKMEIDRPRVRDFAGRELALPS
jgi:hypothetical protein